jgi:hypothetical protein
MCQRVSASFTLVVRCERASAMRVNICAALTGIPEVCSDAGCSHKEHTRHETQAGDLHTRDTYVRSL